MLLQRFLLSWYLIAVCLMLEINRMLSDSTTRKLEDWGEYDRALRANSLFLVEELKQVTHRRDAELDDLFQKCFLRVRPTLTNVTMPPSSLCCSDATYCNAWISP